MGSENGQFVKQILKDECLFNDKRNARYNARKTGRFGFPNEDDYSLVSGSNLQEANFKTEMSFKLSMEQSTSVKLGLSSHQHNIQTDNENTQWDQSQEGQSVAVSHINQPRDDEAVPESKKSTLKIPDNKSMFSQYDVMSQYSNYIEIKD